MTDIETTLNDLNSQLDKLIINSAKHITTVGYVYVRPYNLGLLVEQLPEGVSVGPALGDTLPSIFSEYMANANLHLVQGIAREPEIKYVSIQQYLTDSIENTENVIKMIKLVQSLK